MASLGDPARDILRVGQITNANPKAGAARTAHDDLKGPDGPYTAPVMQMLYPAMGRWRAFYIPKEGDHAAALRLPNGKQQGFILGTFYSESNMPVDGADGVIQLITDDGKNLICLNADGTVIIKLMDNIHIETKDLTAVSDVHIEGNVDIKGNLDITGDVEITGNFKSNGETAFNGGVTIKGDLTLNGSLNLPEVE